ncbi:hypothetical protein S7711_11321 [Stachybotrys chartarum IBT 7711]|uniref:Uncharacterized protein n=1 Tax=Stachybotrys chartarum (strain CBS 109288 / IBT 7711) TaxID=1280523 RepID=A0A084AYS1_STACB|nr:hypothetical protein S7711_11321 [Stachybotrys chartarum IBT 7711]KFA50429.1 hypothetical protein S40293_10911 [Stachybotrys chartarum IBT 40293]KFA74734.1 hypothetical protein S40288_10857 [Stachybotrys chartarum IBT 40288]
MAPLLDNVNLAGPKRDVSLNLLRVLGGVRRIPWHHNFGGKPRLTANNEAATAFKWWLVWLQRTSAPVTLSPEATSSLFRAHGEAVVTGRRSNSGEAVPKVQCGASRQPHRLGP